jgi:predicted metal-dependent HD superfamily phosphohydrolase
MHAPLERFSRIWRSLAADGDPAPVATALLTRWSEPWRHYHTLEHLDHCLTGLDQCRSLADDPSELEVALWFHDAIYDPHSPDNEIQSAALARETLTRAQVNEPRVERVERLILATRTHVSDGNADTALLLDLDLSVLGAAPTRYADYADAIRREYAWVPEATYRQKRVALLGRFLTRPALFLTPRFYQSHEAPARRNLAEEIARLS